MKYYHFTYILIIGFLLFVVYVLFTRNKDSELQLQSQADVVLKMDGFYQFLKFKDKEIYINNGAMLSPDLTLFDANGASVKLSEIIDDNTNTPKLIIRYSAMACDICLDEELKIIQEFLAKLGKENIKILASNHNVRSLIVKKNNLSIDLPIYRIEDTGIAFEKNHTNLFVFMIDKNYIVNDFFIPEKTMPELSKDYYSAIIKKYSQ